MKSLLPAFLLMFGTLLPTVGAPVSFWEDLFRSATKGDDAFRGVKRAEPVAEALARDRALARKIGGEIGDATDVATRSRKVKALLETSLHQPDPAILRQIEKLDPGQMEAALVLARGSRRIIETVPDVVGRGRLLRDGGADIVAAAGIHGDDLAREASRVEGLVTAGALPGTIANKGTIARFAEVMREGDGGAWSFWKEYVAPHWKKWLAGGGIVAYLANPELFHNAAGELTEHGARQFTLFTGEVVDRALKGAADGALDAANKLGATFREKYLRGPNSWVAWLGLAVFCWSIGVLLPRTRRLSLLPVAWLFRKPKARDDHEQDR